MSRREDVQNTIWDDEPFASLSPNGKLLYLWSFTNQKCNMAGLYRVRVETMTLETGLAQADVHAALAELAESGTAYYERGVLWVRARIKRLTSKSPNMKKAIRRCLDQFAPGEPLRERCIRENADLAWLEGTLPEPFSKGSDFPDGDAVSGNRSETVHMTEPQPGSEQSVKRLERIANVQAIFQRFDLAIDEVSVLNALERFPDLDHEQLAMGCAEWCRTHGRPPGLTFHRFLQNEARDRAEIRVREEHKPTHAGMVTLREVCQDCGERLEIAKRSQGRCNPCQDRFEASLTGEAA